MFAREEKWLGISYVMLNELGEVWDVKDDEVYEWMNDRRGVGVNCNCVGKWVMDDDSLQNGTRERKIGGMKMWRGILRQENIEGNLNGKYT